MKRPIAKASAISGIAACVLLLLLVGLGAINWSTFWICIGIVAAFAFFVLPKIKK